MRLGRYDETAVVSEQKVLVEKVNNNFSSGPLFLQITLIAFFVKVIDFRAMHAS